MVDENGKAGFVAVDDNPPKDIKELTPDKIKSLLRVNPDQTRKAEYMPIGEGGDDAEGDALRAARKAVEDLYNANIDRKYNAYNSEIDRIAKENIQRRMSGLSLLPYPDID